MFGLGKKRATFYAGNLGKITLAVQSPLHKTYPFCPYCYGEWLESQFPVVEATDADP